MYGYIYKTTNLINNKIYIGQKCSNKFLGKKYLGSGTLLIKAVNKYQAENFSVELIDKAYSKQQLDDKEIAWIKFYNATDRKVGYNITKGGGGTKGLVYTQEQRARLSQIRKGRYVSPETCEKIRKALKGRTHKGTRNGKHCSEEMKQKLRAANLGKKYSEEVCKKHRGRPAWNKGIPMTEDAKRHLSQINKGKKHSEETKQKMRQSHPHISNPKSQETRNKISQALKGRLWITNGIAEKSIKPEEFTLYINKGYTKGRATKKKNIN